MLKKRMIGLILAIFMVISTVSSITSLQYTNAASPANNIAENASFELGSGTTPTGWSLGANHGRANDRSHDGSYSLKSTATTTSVTARTVIVQPDTTYKLSVWIYKTNNNGTAYIDMNDISGEAQTGTGVGLGAGQWSYSEALWSSGNATSITLRAVTDASPTGTIWFDDIRLVPIASTNLIDNGSFESGSGTAATGWTLGTGHERSDDRSYEGEYSLKSTATNTSVSSRTVSVQPNTSYTLSAWIYKMNNSGTAYIDMDNRPFEVEIGMGEGLGGGEWSYVEALWYNDTATSITLRAVVDGNPTAEIWFDDFVLVPLPSTANKVVNGSFEIGSDDAAVTWTQGLNHSRSNDRAYEGEYALKSTATSTSTSSTTVIVKPDTLYKLSVWIYKTNNDGSAYIDMNDMNAEAEIGTGSGQGGMQWSYSETIWNSGALESITLRAVTDDNPTAAIWFDDIRLEPITASSSLVDNGSFEIGSGTTATGWMQVASHVRTNDKSHDGSYALKSVTSGTAASAQTIPVETNTTYKLSGWIYKSNGDDIAYLDMDDQPGEAQVGVDAGDGEGQWVYVETLWNSGSTASIGLRTVSVTNSTDAIWFDDIRLNPVWKLHTGDTDMMLEVSNNRPAISQLKNTEKNWNWTPASTSLPLLDRVDVGGTPVTPDWLYQDAVVDTSQGKKVTLRFVSDTPNLELKSIWWARPDSGPIEHWMTIENKTGGTITVYQQESLQIDVKGDSNPTLWRFHKESGQPDAAGTYKTLLTHSDSLSAWTNTNQDFNSNGFIPLVFLDVNAEHGLYIGWEWPEGRILTETAAAGIPAVITVNAGLNNDFKTDIPEEGFYEIPSAYIGAYNGDVDNGSNKFKRWFFNNKAPEKMRTDTREPYAQMAEQLLGLNYDLASWGVDSIQWDYGWWPGSPSGGWRTGEGDWRLGNPQYYEGLDARGLTTWSEYGEYLESAGLEYTNYFLLHDGLSSDPNALSSIGPNAHPEWFSNRQISAGRSVDLGNSEAVDFMKQRLLAVMSENKIDTYRSDFEPIVRASDKTNRHQYSSDVQYWSAKGFYEILDYMFENLPGFRYENNSSGGSLKDYATMSRSNVVVYNDTANYEDARKTFYTTSYGIPSAQLISYINPDLFSSIPGEDDYGWRSIILGTMHIASPGAVGGHLPYNGDYYAEKYFGMFRDKLKPLVRNADLYHILPRPDGTHWDGIQYFDPAATGAGEIKGVTFLFKPGNAEGNTKTIKFRGLDPLESYAVEFEDRSEQNTIKTGAELMAGLEVTIAENRGSEMIWLKDDPGLFQNKIVQGTSGTGTAEISAPASDYTQTPDFASRYTHYFDQQFSDQPLQLAVTAPGIVASGDYTVSQSNNSEQLPSLSYGGSVEISNSYGSMSIGDAATLGTTAIYSGSSCVIGPTSNLVIYGDVVCNGPILFNGNIDGLTIHGNVIAAGDITFNSNVDTFTIEGTMSSQGSITFKGSNVTSGNIEGDLIGQGIRFNGLNTLVVSGNVSSSQDFMPSNGNYSGLLIGGSLYVSGNSQFSTFSKVTIQGSYFGKGNINMQGQISGNGLRVGHSMLSNGTIDFQGIGGQVYVGEYLGALYQLNFKGNISGAMHLGGILAGKINIMNNYAPANIFLDN
ncbi:carbohydrate binding domain-containing protein [Paenibacillus nasutitermitis]|uniref:CBM-cenC domain-containing protein n=1 Tax=Paenibacillus nasutitermitis TaxID=1652958 RepID=A0A917DY43_9BACL|nr:carbohydrate binding domain-containing protein [Paenibacillus nasutitermitis]GGD79905.1 hypothetical protein GCM10010911_42510 [Paenibacillus nasutitermitis]